jgi:pantoate--beta-alanine ligase
MRAFNTISDIRSARRELVGTVGFVPTMGYLHEGHLALVQHALRENTYAVVSIFVNPTQFGPNEDFSRYPRDIARDLTLLESVKTTLVFLPTVDDMYPQGAQTVVDVTGVSQGLEGERRPGHFRGVATIVSKLFHIIEPDRAYFGQKDAQQVAVIRQMVRDLNFPLEMVVSPTVRAADGLALSSRNVYLTPEQRAAAPVLYRALSQARESLLGGEHNSETLRNGMQTLIQSEPLAQIEYVSVSDGDTLREFSGLIRAERPVLFSLAVRFGATRLIDNVTVDR